MDKTLTDIITELMANTDYLFQEGVIFTKQDHESLNRLNQFIGKLLIDPFYKHE